MNDTPSSGGALEALRHELDGIDAKLLKLLGERFVLTEQVKALKQVTAKVTQTPLRPAREAMMLRKLLTEAREKGLNPNFVLRQWRNIIAESIHQQAPITIHIPQKLSATIGNRLRIRDHFGAIPVEEWKDESQALMQVNASHADLCIVETDSNWIEPMIAGKAGGAQVLQTLPVIGEDRVPKLLVMGRALVEATGQDETLVITQGSLPRDFAVLPIWQTKVGPFKLSALAGFFSEHEAPLVGIMRSNSTLGLMVAGRYPSMIEI
jgi:chorismate mutase / prephenate dehydratase